MDLGWLLTAICVVEVIFPKKRRRSFCVARIEREPWEEIAKFTCRERTLRWRGLVLMGAQTFCGSEGAQTFFKYVSDFERSVVFIAAVRDGQGKIIIRSGHDSFCVDPSETIK